MLHHSVVATYDLLFANPTPMGPTAPLGACHVIASAQLHGVQATLWTLLCICQRAAGFHLFELPRDLAAVLIARSPGMGVGMVVAEQLAARRADHLCCDLSGHHIGATQVAAVGAFTDQVVFPHHHEALVFRKGLLIRQAQHFLVAGAGIALHVATAPTKEAMNLSTLHPFFDPILGAVSAAAMIWSHALLKNHSLRQGQIR
mmetsp:Transcript_67030/g.146955  ORF Transcript_67030/g.146955 Transcript_67030/m.146955 type:complete len:202 (-) Transcript_67030:507-1112(-)